jgi:hypothetical protein
MKVCLSCGVVAFMAITLGSLIGTSTAFEYSGYCQKMCMWGRGGNLCKCNAVHFAGKRGSLSETGFEVSSPEYTEERQLEDTDQMEEDDPELRTMLGQTITPLTQSHRYQALIKWLEKAASRKESKPDNTMEKTAPNSLTRKFLVMALRKLIETPESGQTIHENSWDARHTYEDNM